MTRPRNAVEAGRAAATILRRRHRGSRSAVTAECDRAARITSDIWKRWQVGPWRWQQKHVRWYLEHCTDTYSDWTRYRYWLTITRILKAIGRLDDWRAGLGGPWTAPHDTSQGE